MIQGNPNQVQPGQDAGLDIEGQIREGVIAFTQSQDPAIAVEVVLMLAETMGIAPDVNAQPGQAGIPPLDGGVPSARNGGKFARFKIGGRIVGRK